MRRAKEKTNKLKFSEIKNDDGFYGTLKINCRMRIGRQYWSKFINKPLDMHNFPSKNFLVESYHLIIIFYLNITMAREWKQEELKLLDQSALHHQAKNWKRISMELSKQGYSRSEVQCRYKWVNYLAPNINHNPWSEDELIALFNGYQLYKSQWTLIQRNLPGRTQIKIRNQFYGIIRNIIRFAIKYFKTGNGKWSIISNQVKPQTLQSLYDGNEKFDFIGDLVKETVKKMSYIFKKSMLGQIISEHSSTFQKIVKIIIQENQEITRTKSRRPYNDVPNQIQPNISPQHQNQDSFHSEPQNLMSPQIQQIPPQNLSPQRPLFSISNNYTFDSQVVPLISGIYPTFQGAQGQQLLGSCPQNCQYGYWMMGGEQMVYYIPSMEPQQFLSNYQ